MATYKTTKREKMKNNFGDFLIKNLNIFWGVLFINFFK